MTLVQLERVGIDPEEADFRPSLRKYQNERCEFGLGSEPPLSPMAVGSSCRCRVKSKSTREIKNTRNSLVEGLYYRLNGVQ